MLTGNIVLAIHASH